MTNTAIIVSIAGIILQGVSCEMRNPFKPRYGNNPSAIECPTLVIGGDHDAIPVPHTVLIAQNIPRSYLWIIPESGHSTPIFKRDQFNTIVGDFFSKPYREIKGPDTFK